MDMPIAFKRTAKRKAFAKKKPELEIINPDYVGLGDTLIMATYFSLPMLLYDIKRMTEETYEIEGKLKEQLGPLKSGTEVMFSVNVIKKDLVRVYIKEYYHDNEVNKDNEEEEENNSENEENNEENNEEENDDTLYDWKKIYKFRVILQSPAITETKSKL